MEGEFLPLQMLFACFGERIDAPLLETQSRGSENYWPRSRESSTVNCGKETRSPVLADGGKYRVALAFSGGLDSRLLAVLLRKAGMEPLLFHVFGPHSIRGESLKAVSWAYENAFTTVCLPLNPLVIPQVRANERRRCYYCKQAMFTAMSGMSDLPLCDGTLASDLKTYRPGLQALQELGVVSPLALAGFDKERVSGVALFLGLDRPDQPSQSCLLTRFGYDVPLDEGLLNEFALADAEITHYWEDFCQREGYGPVYQSLRLVDTQTLEWHIEGLALPITEGRALVERIGAVAPSLPPLRIRQVERVKGFFDTPLHNNIAT